MLSGLSMYPPTAVKTGSTLCSSTDLNDITVNSLCSLSTGVLDEPSIFFKTVPSTGGNPGLATDEELIEEDRSVNSLCSLSTGVLDEPSIFFKTVPSTGGNPGLATDEELIE